MYSKLFIFNFLFFLREKKRLKRKKYFLCLSLWCDTYLTPDLRIEVGRGGHTSDMLYKVDNDFSGLNNVTCLGLLSFASTRPPSPLSSQDNGPVFVLFLHVLLKQFIKIQCHVKINSNNIPINMKPIAYQ